MNDDTISKHITCFIGAPGSGKGTQINYLKDALSTKCSMRHFSPGEEMRKQGLMNSTGNLASLDVVNNLLNAALSAEVDLLIIDGYPRSIEQAQYLINYLTKHNVILHLFIFNISYEAIINRLEKRIVCTACSYTASTDICSRNTSTNAYQCSQCKGDMMPREDDTSKEAIKTRYNIFKNSFDDIKILFAQSQFINIYNIFADNQHELIYNELLGYIKNILSYSQQSNLDFIST